MLSADRLHTPYDKGPRECAARRHGAIGMLRQPDPDVSEARATVVGGRKNNAPKPCSGRSQSHRALRRPFCSSQFAEGLPLLAESSLRTVHRSVPWPISTLFSHPGANRHRRSQIWTSTRSQIWRQKPDLDIHGPHAYPPPQPSAHGHHLRGAGELRRVDGCPCRRRKLPLRFGPRSGSSCWGRAPPSARLPSSAVQRAGLRRRCAAGARSPSRAGLHGRGGFANSARSGSPSGAGGLHVHGVCQSSTGAGGATK